jgi:hypothetical protein
MSGNLKLIFYVPVDSAERVKEALFAIGVGALGNYSHCSFETLGIGQFKPNERANPTIGSAHKIEKVQELKVEMICQVSLINKAVEVLKSTHPYEEVAYEVYRLENY